MYESNKEGRKEGREGGVSEVKKKGETNRWNKM